MGAWQCAEGGGEGDEIEKWIEVLGDVDVTEVAAVVPMTLERFPRTIPRIKTLPVIRVSFVCVYFVFGILWFAFSWEETIGNDHSSNLGKLASSVKEKVITVMAWLKRSL